MTQPDWSLARWITIAQPRAMPAERRACPHLRRTIEVHAGLVEAEMFATAGGLFQPWLNGSRVGVGQFAPGWTDYRRRVPFHRYPLALREGTNTLGVVLGDGWYSGYVGPFQGRDLGGEYPVFRAVIHLRYSDGDEWIATDGTWEGAEGAICGSDMLHGEVFDARRRLHDWSGGGTAGKWMPVIERDGPEGTLEPALIAPAAPVAECAPVATHVVDAGSTIVDFGQNLAGWVRVPVHGAAGTVVRLRFAEVLGDDGRLYFDNLRMARATDTIVLDGTAFVYEPTFTYHGFRFCEITAPVGTVDIANARAVAVSSIAEMTGSFTTDNALINQLQSNIQWTMRSNFIEVPTDCPQRDERLGWGGDAQVFVPTATFNAPLYDFYRKWTRDLLDAQKPDGAFADIAPNGIVDFAEVGAAGYADAGVFVPWYTYQAYGDTGILDRAFSGAQAWVDYVHRHNPGLIWREARASDYGDWLAPVPTDKTLVATAYFAWAALVVSRSADALGHDAEAARYRALHADIAAAYRAEFWPGRTDDTRTQTAFTLALAFELLGDDQRAEAQAALVENVERLGHLSVGFLAVRHIMHELTAAGRTDLAMRMLLREESPSWGYQIRRGATTIGEHWDAWDAEGAIKDPWMNSFNHFCLGSVGEWMYAELGAIAPTSPGYRTFRVRPAIGHGVNAASARHLSPFGEIVTAWAVEDGILHLSVTVPTGSSAEVILPGSARAVDAGHHTFTEQIAP